MNRVATIMRYPFSGEVTWQPGKLAKVVRAFDANTEEKVPYPGDYAGDTNMAQEFPSGFVAWP